MIVRKINDSELKRTSELFCIAFEFGSRSEKTNEEMLEDIKNNPDSRHSKYYNEAYAAFNDDNDMMSYIGTMPYDVNFDGYTTKMSGIGGVSTLPHYRKSGGIRGCFEKALTDLYSEGFEFSYLYPFSTYYYAKFGYSICGQKYFYTINLKSIKPFDDAKGKIVLHEGDKCYNDIKQIYFDYTKKYNMAVVRQDFDFIWFKNAAPAKSEAYTYVYYDINNIPLGAMTFNKVKDNDKFNMNCTQFYFSNMEGFKGLLNLTSAFSTYYENICFNLPCDINITSYINEWAIYPYKRESINMGMARVVNLEKVLKLAKYKGNGELIIKINDLQIPQNNNIFKLVYKNNSADSINIDNSLTPDVTMSINDFSALILGDRITEEICFMDKVDLNCDIDKLKGVFYKKPLFICDGF